MFVRFLLSLVFLVVFGIQYSIAQCSCTDCPINTISNGTVTSTLNINGATNPTMGAAGQGLAEICIDYFTDAVNEVDMTLTAPNGTQVLLIENTGISVNSNLNFQICFVPCGCPAEPDPGFTAVFDSDEDWLGGVQYDGTYYPSVGCLEDLNGPVDGNWTLTVQDFIGQDDGVINNWTLSFLDNAGLPCIMNTNCVPEICEADAGEISQPLSSYCEGDPALDFNIAVTYPGGTEPNSVEYGYTFVISDADTGEILEYQDDVDLSSYEIGSYQVCGLSYLIDDLPTIPTPNGTYSIQDLTNNIISELFCASLSNVCFTVVIQTVEEVELTGPTSVCLNELYTYTIENYDPSTTYDFIISLGPDSQIDSEIAFPDFNITWIQGTTAEICVESFGDCGESMDCVDVIIEPTVEIDVAGDMTICMDDIYTYVLDPPLETDENWSFNVNGGVVIDQTSNSVLVIWDVNNADTGELCVSKDGGDCASAETCVDVIFAIPEIPLDFITPNTLCLGEADVSFVLQDPNIASYNWLLTNLTEIAGNGTPSIQYETDQIGPATICLELTDLCDNVYLICKEILVSDSPNLFISGETEICGLSTELSAQVITGAAVSWTQVSNSNLLFIAEPSNLTTVIIANVPGSYDIELTAEVNGCISTDIVTLVFTEELDLIELEEICLNGTTYYVSFSILGGVGPYFINGIELVGNDYISETFESGENYSFSITDNEFCEIDLSSSFSCDCETEAGLLEAVVSETCAEEGNEVVVSQVGNPVLDADDTAVFVFHDTENLLISTVLFTNETGVFIYDASIIPGQQYYISYVVGNGVGSSIDLDDPCLAVSPSLPVIFYAPPSSNELPELLSCENFLVFNFDNLQNTDDITWTLIEGDGTASTDVVDLETTFQINGFGKFIFGYELTNQSCSTTGLLDIFVVDTFRVENSEFICQSNGSNYDLNIEVSGGTGALVLDGPGSISDGIITAENLVDSEIYTFMIVDTLGCSFEFSYGPVLCDCEKEIGTINSQLIELCIGDQLDPTSISNQDFIYQAGIDSFAYYIYDDMNAPLDQFITISDGSLLNFDPLFTTNQTYYLRLIVGLITSDSIDLMDDCLQFSDAIPFMWLSDYQFFTDVHPLVCASDNTYTWSQFFPGPFPYSLTFSLADGDDVTVEVLSEEQEITLPVFPGASEWEIIDATVPCGWSFMGNLTITGQEEELISLIPFDTICNSSIGGSTVLLEDLLEENIFGNWFLNGDLIIDALIDFDGFPIGDYELVFSTVGFESPCPGSEEMFTFYIEECLCPEPEIDDLSICNDQENINVADIVPPGEYNFDILNIENLPNPVIVLGQEIQLQGKSPGSYGIVYELTDVDPFCPAIFTATLVLEEKYSAGISSLDVQFCEDEVEINLNDYLTDASPNGSWYRNDNPIDALVELTLLDIGVNNFLYITDEGEYCASDSASLSIEKINNPSANLISTDVLCFGDENGSLEIEIFSDDYGPYTCTINNENNGAKLIEDLPPGEYQVIVSNVAGCVTELDPITISEPDIVTVDLGDDLSVAFNDELTIEALVNILASDISDISWTDLSGQINNDDLILIQNALENNTIEITITDANGCVAIDNINIRLLDFDIMLANVLNLNSNFPENRVFGVPDIPTIAKINSFQIYDRWGERVFHQTDILPGSEEAFWDGTFKANQVQQGVYAYYLSYEDFLGRAKVITGDVTLIK